MLAVIAVLALIVAALYGFIGLYIVPRLARLADHKGSLISFAQYGAAAFFLGCAMTHVAIAVHTLVEPNLVEGHEWVHLAPHILQVVGGTLFSVIAWTKLDVKLRTKEQARLEEESERLRDQLERSQRLGSLGQLAGGLAHDFNNLLAVILGYGRFLQEKLVDGDAELRADVEEIVGAAQRGADLTRQMLVFSRGPEVSFDATDVNHAVEASATLLRRAVGENVRLKLSLAGGLPLVRLGRGQVEQVLLNLALNARDAMPDGGALEIATAPLAPPDGRDDAAWVRVTVADTGHGMSGEVLAKAFDPFFTTKPEGKGTGLGLSMVYGMVERVGGRVDLDSASGRGTRITIDLPGAQAAATTEAVNGREPLQLRDVTVLIVEDQPSVRAVAARTLADRGAWIVEAADGEEALRLLADHAGAVDVVLTDIVMPGMSGTELAASLRRERPALPVVFMSGYTGDDVELPEDAVLVGKPFTADDLVAAIAEVLPVSFLANG